MKNFKRFLIFFGFFIFLMVSLKIISFFIQPTPKIYETVDGKIYLENGHENKLMLESLDNVKIANGIAKGFQKIIKDNLQSACSKVGGYYYRGLCYIGKLTIVDGKGIISNGNYNYLDNNTIDKLIDSCSKGVCPIGYVDFAGVKDDFVDYNVTYYKENKTPRPVGSTLLVTIFNKDNSYIENILKNYIANELGVNPSSIDVKVENKMLVGSSKSDKNEFLKQTKGYVIYSVSETATGYADSDRIYINQLFGNPSKEKVFLSANKNFSYTIKDDPNYKDYVEIITGCDGVDWLNKIFPNSCKYIGREHSKNWPIFKCHLDNNITFSKISSKIGTCKNSFPKSMRLFYLNYTNMLPGMKKYGKTIEFLYPYVDCGYRQSGSGKYIIYADGINILYIMNSGSKTCVDTNNNVIDCSKLGLKSLVSEKDKLYLSGFNGITFKLSLNNEIKSYTAYKVSEYVFYLIRVFYNGHYYYYEVKLSDIPYEKGKISESINTNYYNQVKLYDENIDITVKTVENKILYSVLVSEIFNEE